MPLPAPVILLDPAPDDDVPAPRTSPEDPPPPDSPKADPRAPPHAYPRRGDPARSSASASPSCSSCAWAPAASSRRSPGSPRRWSSPRSLLGALTTVAGAARWCVVARGVGLTLPLGEATADAYRATLLNSLLPAGVLGDVHRAVRHHRPGDGRGARAVVIERVAGQVVVVAVGAAVLFAQPAVVHAVVGPGPRLRRGRRRAPRRRRRRLALDRRGARRGGASGSSRRCATSARASAAGAPRPPSSCCRWWRSPGCSRCSSSPPASPGSPHPLGQLLPLVTVALLAMSVPLTVGGWGPREAVAAVAFAAVGLDPGQGLATAVVYGVLALISCAARAPWCCSRTLPVARMRAGWPLRRHYRGVGAHPRPPWSE